MLFRSSLPTVNEVDQNSFRPLTGIMVLIDVTDIINDYCEKKFPSPYGDYGSYQLPLVSLRNLSLISFRPLTGIMVLITGSHRLAALREIEEFPSPYGDYGSYHVVSSRNIRKCKKQVSVPLRGLWFLSANCSNDLLWR